MKDQDLDKIKEQFESIGKKDIKSLRSWFKSHQDLTNAELSHVIGTSEQSIIHTKKRWGVDEVVIIDFGNCLAEIERLEPYKPPREPKYNDEIEPLNINRVCELYEKGYSLRRLAHIFQCSKERIKRMLAKENITIDNNEQKHPLNNIEWLKEHHIDKMMGMRECARLAGVSASTIRQWLTKAGISIRYYQCHPRYGLEGYSRH